MCIVTLSIQALKLHFGNYSSPAWVQCSSWGTLLFPCCFEQTCNLHVCTVLKVARYGLAIKLGGICITCNFHEHMMLCFLALSLSLSLSFLFSFFFGLLQAVRLLAFLWPSLFVSLVIVSTIDLLLDLWLLAF